MIGKTNEEILGLMAVRLIEANRRLSETTERAFARTVIEANTMKAAYEADPAAPLILHKLSYDLDEAYDNSTFDEVNEMLELVWQFYKPWFPTADKAGNDTATV